MNIDDLLKEDECEWLDFKETYHSDNVKLVHDILCLLNTATDRDRYLVFGVSDSKAEPGIQNDPNRKGSAELQDLLRQYNFNRMPTIKVKTHKRINSVQIDVVEITNRPDKPFFLTKDKRNGKNTIRAGVIYTRIGDTNVPLKESAPKDQIELMWRERFGIGLPPLTRMLRLLDDPTAWVRMDGDEYLYHRDFPEYTIIRGREVHPRFSEEWSKKFPDPNASSIYVELRYNNTILKRSIFVLVDGARYFVPLPQRIGPHKWRISRKSIEFKISEVYSQWYPLATALKGKGVEIE